MSNVSRKKRPIFFCFVILVLMLITGCRSGKINVEKKAPSPESLGALIHTQDGIILGAENGKTWAWKGIPFAKPPVGDLRWKAPEDPEPWTGVMHTKEFKSSCPQFDGNLTGKQSVIGDENCLYLNVWRPQTQEQDLPVYFWIHGGGNSVGSAAQYEGNNIAGKSNMVVVTIQYRLGPLGWFTFPDLREGKSVLDDSGNYGTLDMIKALKWVQQNITAFGGNPDNVTIAGESAGGLNVYTMVISQLTKGLFSKAMVQSGGFWTTPMEAANADGQKVLERLLELDAKPKIERSEVGEYLRGKSVEEIFDTYTPGAFGIIFGRLGAYLDGNVLPKDGIEALSNPDTYRQVPIIVGANKEETKFFNFSSYKKASARAYQEDMLKQSAAWIEGGVDKPVGFMLANDNQPPIFAYQLNYGAYSESGYNAWPNEATSIKFGACHVLDIPLFWSQYPFLPLFQGIFRPNNKAGYNALSDAMMGYVAQFAHTGNPGTVNGVTWERWHIESNQPKRILFDANAAEAIITMSNQ